MAKIVINFERGPDEQPAGRLTLGSGQVVEFTGWLSLIRLLEDELHRAPQPPGGGPAGSAT
jgi:hypothetical protein